MQPAVATAMKKGKVLAATTSFTRSPPTRKKDTDSKVSTGFSSHVTYPKSFRLCRHGEGPIRENAYRVVC
jgi:hypothetical protein